MIHRKGPFFNVFLPLALCAAVALLAACGDTTKKSTSPASTSGQAAVIVGMSTCTTCHTVVTDDWLTSKHANLDPDGGLDSPGMPSSAQVTAGACADCHDPTGDSNHLSAGYTGNVSRPVVGCEACHGAGSLHADAGGAGPIFVMSNANMTTFGTVTVSGQFVMCTTCHQLLDTLTGTGTTAATHDPASTQAPIGTQYTITDTHFATPLSYPSPTFRSETDITGYAFDYSDEKACANCHNPHKTAAINREWAQSAHADKNPLNLNSTTPPSGYFSGAWSHYNWSCDGSSADGCAATLSSSSRKACQRCHTTTGFQLYANALREGDTSFAALINAGSYTIPNFYSPQFKPEMLKCNGCHLDNKGNLRNPGPVTANYDFVSGTPPKTYAKASHTYPDLAGSNVCMLCHTGREAGETIHGLNDPALSSAGTISTFSYTNSSFINSHYLTAGGLVFTVTGYTFGNRPYNNGPEYVHDKIGTTATEQLPPFVNTGSNGPCVGCHMSRPNKNGNHLFLPVSRSTVTHGEITGIASEVCFKCHGPSTTLILDMVREQRAQFMGALEALKGQMALKRQMYFFPNNPYWFRTSPYTDPKADCNNNVPVKNWQTGGDGELTTAAIATMPSCTQIKGNDNGTVGTGQNNMGAAFNFNVLEHDPGAYVHNRMYVKRLIYDSIDWIDDGALNFSVGATLDALDPATYPYKGEAMIYLLPYGVFWNGTYPAGNGIEAERP